MKNRHIHLRDISFDDVRALILAGDGAIRGVDPTDRRIAMLADAYRAAKAADYRIDRATWTERDNRIGLLGQPSKLSEWPECTVDDARFTLARGVWSDAVRLFNIANM